ncbi:MAG: hypothetical protein K6T31_09930, partial [Alicyclobacillus sp.]|nr:hypothetical protein [Alicyclobacillus sp.]
MNRRQQRDSARWASYGWGMVGAMVIAGWALHHVSHTQTAAAATAPAVTPATPAAVAQTADVVVHAFQATGALATGYRVHGWAVVSQPPAQLAQLVTTLEQENGVASANISERTFTGEDGSQGYAASGQRRDGSRVLVVAAQTPVSVASQPLTGTAGRLGADAGNPREVTVAVEIDGALTAADLGHSAAFQQAWRQLAASLAAVADSPQIDGCIQGKRDARMSGGSEEG